MKKKAIIAGVLGALLLGGVTCLAWTATSVGRVLFSTFQVLLLPINFLIQSVIGTSDAYYNVYVAVDIIFMSIIGFFVSYYLCRAFQFLKKRRRKAA